MVLPSHTSPVARKFRDPHPGTVHGSAPSTDPVYIHTVAGIGYTFRRRAAEGAVAAQ
jgi:hypothetical protein